MKKKTIVVSLLLTLALVLGSFSSAFAAFEVGSAMDGNELSIETAAKALYDDTTAGKYKLVDTATLKRWVNKKSAVVVDTMPAGWFAKRHIPGAINSVVGEKTGAPAFTISADEKAALLQAVNAKVGKVKVTYYWNAKTKKWVTKKPAAKNWKKCTKKKDKNYGKKKYTVKEVNKKKAVVVYCGFVGCKRSHEAAKFLVQKGFTKVYRHPGGISAWGDAGYAIEGSDAA